MAGHSRYRHCNRERAAIALTDIHTVKLKVPVGLSGSRRGDRQKAHRYAE
jgi:hypothetical protein